MSESLARTPLWDWHASHGGRLVDFAGWSMPVQYTSIVAEHQATRRSVGLFDISHMGRLRFDGPGAAPFLEGLLTRRAADMKPGQVRYSLVTNQAGGILDDVLVYALADAAGGTYFLMVVNASNRAKITGWLEAQRSPQADVTWTDVTEPWAMIAVQGPRALEVVEPLVEADPRGLKYYHAAETRVAGHGGIVSRTGYTGEDGVELIIGSRAVAGVWESLVEASRPLGGLPAGLGARDTLRLEAAMPLYGHELGEEINPYQAGLGFAVALQGRKFPGSEALLRIKDDPGQPKRVGLALTGKRVAREGSPILAAGEPVGQVTSGTFSPTLERPIAMGYVRPERAAVGTELEVDIRGRREPVKIVELPFYRRQ